MLTEPINIFLSEIRKRVLELFFQFPGNSFPSAISYANGPDGYIAVSLVQY